MACITVSLEKPLKERLTQFPWVNWSELAKEESAKKDIFERYLKAGEVTDEDWEFCEKINWHPVDELPMKEEFKKRIEAARKQPSKRYKSVDEFFSKLK